MRDGEALKVAVDLLHVPSRLRMARADPLPRGVPLLLLVAANDREAVGQAVHITDRSQDVVRDAAAFFIEQVLLCPEADSYRVLGASPQATRSELRRNMACLIKWLHPDSDPHAAHAIFASRVTMAWEDLKTPERRAAYDSRRARDQERPARERPVGRPGRSPFPGRETRRRRRLLQALRLLLSGARR